MRRPERARNEGSTGPERRDWVLDFGVWNLGFGVWVWGLRFGNWDLGFEVWGLGAGVKGSEFGDGELGVGNYGS